ncbi:MAG TPA: radical SAM protein [Polyangiaceae bacterium]
MRALLLRPDPGNDRFGLGPFFLVEPLGLAYAAAALAKVGVTSTVADLRFRPSLARVVKDARPALVAISCLHALEYDRAVEAAREVKRLAPEAFVVIGGHAAAAHAEALFDDAVDAVSFGDAELVMPALASALRGERPMTEVPDLVLRGGERTRASDEEVDLSLLPDRSGLERHRNGYRCLFHRPVWVVETARGCPYRCSFCSVSVLHGRELRERPISAVVEDLARVGDRIFIVDDLFFANPERSLELARALEARHIKKRWILVQTRADLAARREDVLAAWRARADAFDVFVGFESSTDASLAKIAKDTTVAKMDDGLGVLRRLGFGVTGNFVIDPDWAEDDFHALWDYVAERKLERAGYTILTPLPGTKFYFEQKARIGTQPWHKFDMHHLLWEPRLGRERFLELYAETWRRSVLNARAGKVLDWLGRVRPTDAPDLLRMILRTQRMMRPSAYLAE